MAAAGVDITESAALTVLRSFLLALLPGIEVIRSQVNRVPEPKAADFVVMTPLLRERLSTNLTAYDDPGSAPGTRADTQPTRISVQLDLHGPASSDNAQIITTVMRADNAMALFAAAGAGVVPLYAGDPRQAAFINGEQQFEDRWVVEISLQINPTVTRAQDFAGSLNVTLASVDALFPQE